jgi:hypothetical protein
MKGVNLQRRYQKVSAILFHWEEDGQSKDAVNAQEEARNPSCLPCQTR